MIGSMSTFVAVVEAGSFSEAGRRLGQAKSVISRRVEQLEDRLGVRLLQRSTRSVCPTEVGQEYYRRCVQILAEIQAAEELVRQDQVVPAGLLRVQLPIELGMHVFGRLLAEFARENPNLSLELELSNRAADMIEERFDLAIRIGAMPDSALIARKILSIDYGFFASPDYLDRRGEPTSLEDLRSHSCLRFQTGYISGDWPVSCNGHKTVFRPAGSITVNCLKVLREAAMYGLGIAKLPAMMCQEAVANGLLRPVMRNWVADSEEAFVLYPSRQHLSVKVRSFLAFLDQRIGRMTEWMNAPVEVLGPPVSMPVNGGRDRIQPDGLAAIDSYTRT
jgi:DNA-binding transcriptional LysR family regulator